MLNLREGERKYLDRYQPQLQDRFASNINQWVYAGGVIDNYL